MTYGRPGVYISERLLPAPIAATGTANAAGAAIGQFAQGPTSVTLVTSWYDFVRRFGGYNVLFPATFGVAQFFKNGGTELYIRRVLNTASADTATATIAGASSGTTGTVTAKNIGADGNNLRVKLTSSTRANYYTLTVYKEAGVDAGSTADDIILEQYPNVLTNDGASSDFIESVVNSVSSYITVSISSTSVAPSTSLIPLTGGNDGTGAQVADFQNAVDDFTALDRPLVIFAPEISADLGSGDGALVHDTIVSWATNNNGFAVVDTPSDLLPTEALTYAGDRGTASNAAVYYPNIYIQDPLGRSGSSLRKIGPAGAVAGIYLATDRNAGPFKAPAGLRTAISSAIATERQLNTAELDSLNSDASPVNAIRNLPGAGVVIMGVRTLQQDGTANRYVNMRRSLIYIRKQLESLSQFILFENNDELLWARIRTSLGIFLNEYRNQGGLRGATPGDAFYVKCDAENNNASTIANGEVHIEVGVALEYPAEFVVITLSQKTSL